MIQSFADETAADLFRARSTKFARRIPRELWSTVRQKLKLLDVAGRLEDVTVPSAARRAQLRRGASDRQSSRVNDQYRITFRWENGNAYEVRVEHHREGSKLDGAGDPARDNSA